MRTPAVDKTQKGFGPGLAKQGKSLIKIEQIILPAAYSSLKILKLTKLKTDRIVLRERPKAFEPNAGVVKNKSEKLGPRWRQFQIPEPLPVWESQIYLR